VPIYTYKGYDASSGANKKGKIEADSPKSARARLRKNEKIIVSEIKEEASLDKVKNTNSFFQEKVSISDVAIMSRQFATLQGAHVPLDETLKALTEQVDSKVLAGTLNSVKEQVSEGKNLADAMSKFPGVFDKLYINMVRAGESSGTLALVMDRLAIYYEKSVEARGKVASAMAYPIVLSLVMVGMVFFMLLSLVPKLQKVFDSLRVTLPWYTQILVDVSAWLKTSWFMLPVFVAVFYFVLKYWLSSDTGRRKFDLWSLRAPIFGGLVLRIQVSRFTETLSTLLTSGVPIIRALDITKNVMTNSILTKVIEEAKIAVQEGQALGDTIAKSGEFPALVCHMIRTGEKTGQLEEMLEHVAKAYEAEVSRKLDAMISLIEPAMIIMMVAGAGSVMGAVLVPMLSVMNNVR
jgi:general secretion pathway protein F